MAGVPTWIIGLLLIALSVGLIVVARSRDGEVRPWVRRTESLIAVTISGLLAMGIMLILLGGSLTATSA
jgi:uncharacterized membrane protein YidH (DUF202 family)